MFCIICHILIVPVKPRNRQRAVFTDKLHFGTEHAVGKNQTTGLEV